MPRRADPLFEAARRGVAYALIEEFVETDARGVGRVFPSLKKIESLENAPGHYVAHVYDEETPFNQYARTLHRDPEVERVRIPLDQTDWGLREKAELPRGYPLLDRIRNLKKGNYPSLHDLRKPWVSDDQVTQKVAEWTVAFGRGLASLAQEGLIERKGGRIIVKQGHLKKLDAFLGRR